ncbi:MAG: exonuclease III [Flavobacteriaceae bacterium]|jgi:exonuclease III
MKIGTYNLKFLFDEGIRLHSGKERTFTAEFVARRFAYFAEQFNILDADILFLQELGDESALQKILKQTKEKYSYFIAETDKYGVGNAVIYKSSLNCDCSSIPTNTSLPTFDEQDVDNLGPRIWSRRDYINLVTQYKKQTLTLLGVHVKSRFLMFKNASSFPDDIEKVSQIANANGIIRSEMFRFAQVKKIRELVDEVFNNDSNSLVGVVGDFNMSNRPMMYKILTGNVKDQFDTLKRITSIDSFDGICVSKKLEEHISNTTVHNDSVGQDKYDGIESDHAAITFSLS